MYINLSREQGICWTSCMQPSQEFLMMKLQLQKFNPMGSMYTEHL